MSSRRIRDLPDGVSLAGVRFLYPGDGQSYCWVSQWSRGVWGRKQLGDSQLYPLFVETLEECLDWKLCSLTEKDKP